MASYNLFNNDLGSVV